MEGRRRDQIIRCFGLTSVSVLICLRLRLGRNLSFLSCHKSGPQIVETLPEQVRRLRVHSVSRR